MEFDQDYVNYLKDTGELLTSVQVAEYLKIHPSTLSKWRCRKTGPVYIVVGSRAIRYRMKDILDFVESNCRK